MKGDIEKLWHCSTVIRFSFEARGSPRNFSKTSLVKKLTLPEDDLTEDTRLTRARNT